MLPKLPDPSLNPELWGDVDGPSLIAVAATLQLDPENVPWMLNLQRLAAVAAILPAVEGARMLSTSKVRRMVQITGEGLQGMQDPYEGIFAVEVPYFDGPYLMTQGMATHGALAAETLLTAVRFAPRGALGQEFLERAHALASVILSVSDRVCRAFGLWRGSSAGDDENRISIPSARTLVERSSFLQFSEDEVFGDLSPDLRSFLVSRLVREQGVEAPDSVDGVDWLMIRPFVRSGAVLTVASPLELGATLRHHLVVTAKEQSCEAQLVDAVGEVAKFRVSQLFNLMADEPLRTVSQGPGWRRLQATLDEDKLVDLYLVVDDLSGYHPHQVFGTWQATELFQQLEREAESSAAGERVLRVFCPVGVGRDMAVGLGAGDQRTPTIFASFDDLTSMFQTPGFEGLGLWYFARAEERLHEATRVISFSVLDTFSVYCDHDKSFYLSDRRQPELLSVAVASGQELRVSNARRFDRRFFRMPGQAGLAEAWALHGADSSPIYVARTSRGLAHVVDLGRKQAWLQLGVGVDDVQADDHAFGWAIAEAAAFWVWQLWKFDRALFDAHGEVDGPFRIDVNLDQAAGRGGKWVRADRNDGVLQLVLSRGAAVALPERDLDQDLLQEIHLALGGTDPDIWVSISQGGAKKMIHALSPMAVSTWGTARQEVWLETHEAVNELLDELGDHLTVELGLSAGRVPADERVSFLANHVVHWLIDKLGAEIDQLSGQGLLEQLIDRNEAIIAARARDREMLDSRIACFGEAENEVDRIQKSAALSDRSSMSSRFLIEYVTAFPPKGELRLNRERFERLLALASEVINKGMLVDGLRLGLSDSSISVLESGRLGVDVDNDPYFDAVLRFSEARAREALGGPSATRKHPEHQLSDLAEIDALAREAFGFSVTQLAAGFAVFLESLGDQDTATVREADIFDALVSRGGVSRDVASAIVARIALVPFSGSVSSFWAERSAVAPWKFNRDRSYLKRPIALRDGHYSFGRRALMSSGGYWVQQLQSGRLQGNGPLATATGKRLNQKGKDFEQQVAQVLIDLGFESVRQRLRKFGRYEFRDIGGKNLGDIDVAGVHRSSRTLLIVEAKDLEPARTPAELSNEIAALARDPNSALHRLQQRAEWVKTHLPVVLREFGVEENQGWSVVPLIVVGQPLISEFLVGNEPIPIRSIDRLGDHLRSSLR